MNETELKNQRSKAAANYELQKMYVRAGRATQADVTEAKRILDELKAYQLPVTPVLPEVKPVSKISNIIPEDAVVIPAMAVSEFTSLLESLTIERAEAHKQMCLLSNSLADYPDETNLVKLVSDIQEWKLKRNLIGEKITYLKLHGRLPEDKSADSPDNAPEAAQTAFLANLPADRYELNKLLVNSLRPKLTRAKKGLDNAKTETWKAHYAKQAAIAQAEIDLVKSKISAFG